MLVTILPRARLFAVGALLLLLHTSCATRAASPAKAPADPWQDAALGAPAAPGRHTWDGQTLTLTGGGAGLNVKGSDQGQFVYLARAAGDFEIVARLASFSGAGDAAAGLLARPAAAATATTTGTNGGGPLVALQYQPKDQRLNWLSRRPAPAPGAAPLVAAAGIQLAQPPPLWLRLVRVGQNIAVYKSRDGHLWVMISNVSGGPCALDGELQLGLFVTSAGAEQPVTATFDNIAIGPAKMRYQTSWVGNNFGCRDEDNHVSNGLSAMWVAPDGTCYASSYWDEAGQPVTAYRAGKVLRGLPIGTPETAEGGITGDEQHLYVAAVDHIVQLDRADVDKPPQFLTLAASLRDDKAGRSVVSGLASNGRELFVADARENCIRVVLPAGGTHYYTAGNTSVHWAPSAIATDGVAHAAPALVYQSLRETDYTPYLLPGLQPGGAYTVRCHFAEYKEDQPGKRLINVSASGAATVTAFDVVKAAGGKLRPAVLDLPGAKADAKGQLTVTFERGAGGDGHIVICGIEVLGVDGQAVLAVNCGGPALSGWQSECHELGERRFAVERPGPMTVDQRGDLWIIQRGNDAPLSGELTAKYPAAVKCYKADGTFTGRQISDVVNPRALGYDAAKDQLLVAENGPALNVRIYGTLATAPELVRVFGREGGIFSGKHPGLVHDGAAGGDARFAGIAGVGVDAQGNLYVGGGFQGTDLRMFTPSGKLGWQLNSLMFCNTYDVDPESDGAEVYGTFNHVHLDLKQTAPGKEQTYMGYNWDWRRFGTADRAGGSQSIVRRVGPDKQLVMYSSGQGTVGDIKIYRYDGELAIPAGSIRAGTVWCDSNGDGMEQPDEVTKMASTIGWVTSLCVDQKGDVWAGDPSTGGSFMRHFPLRGMTPQGAPIYSGEKGTGYEDIPFPEEGGTTNAWGMACRLDYDVVRDIMIAFFPAVPRTGEGDKSTPQYYLARYDQWSTGNRKSTWKVKALHPGTDPDFFMYEVNFYPYSGYMGMQLAGDYIFLAYVFGEVHAFDLKTGKLVESLAMGPEVNGQSAWEDAAMGLRAFQRKNGEYLIFTENSGWGGKNNLFRWHPAPAAAAGK